MIEAIDTDSDYDLYRLEEATPNPLWKKVGNAIFMGSLFIGGVAVAASYKKKSYSNLGLPFLQSGAPAAAVVVEPEIPEDLTQKTPFASLRCTPVDQRKIGTIITSLADDTLWTQWGKKAALEILGKDIEPIHPLKFLSTILFDPLLRSKFIKLFREGNPMARNEFIKGLAAKLGREQTNLEDYLDEFAIEVGVSADEIRPSIQSADWNGLILYLSRAASALENRTSQA